MNRIGAVIRNARESQNMTQQDLATAIGTSSPHISDLENSKFEPKTTTLRRLAKALKIEVGVFFESELTTYDKSTVNQISDLETASSLEVAKQEHSILQETLLEDAELEMQPTALQRLEEQVRIYGKR